MNRQIPDEEDVLLAFAVEPVHDLATVERYLEKYPQFRAALLACRLELEIADSDKFPLVQPGKSADQAWKRFSQLTGTAANPFAALNSAALRSLALTIDVSVPFVIRLRDRAIAAATIPTRFIQMVAEQLRVQPVDLLSYLRLSPAYGDTNFKSEGKPTLSPQMDFVEAVRSSQLTDAQQKALLALKD
jgi:hypothetical protein